MNRPTAWAPSARWLAFPLFLGYPIWVLLDGVSPPNLPFVLGFVLCAFPLAATFVDRGEGAAWLAPPGAMLAGFLLGLLGSLGILGSPDAGLAVLAGILAGFPLALAAALTRRDLEFGTPWILLVGGVLETMVVQGALVRLANEGLRPAADAFAIACGEVVHIQVGGLGTLLTGGSPGALPLQSFGGTAYALVVLLALVGGFLTFFAPDDDRAADAPRPAPDTLLPFLVAVAAASLFELLAARDPASALLVAGVGIAVATIAIVVFARPRAAPTPLRSKTAPPTDSPPPGGDLVGG